MERGTWPPFRFIGEWVGGNEDQAFISAGRPNGGNSAGFMNAVSAAMAVPYSCRRGHFKFGGGGFYYLRKHRISHLYPFKNYCIVFLSLWKWEITQRRAKKIINKNGKSK